MTDSTGTQIPYSILSETPKGFSYTNDDGLRIQTKTLCAPTAEITRTGWLIDVNEMTLIAEPDSRQTLFQYSDYPFFHKDPNWRITDKSTLNHASSQYDTLLTRFTGVYIAEARLDIPIRYQYFQGNGSNILINNHFICGTLRLPMEEANAGYSGGALYINLKSGGQIVTLSLQELESIFFGFGFQDVLMQLEEDHVVVQFMKKK